VDHDGAPDFFVNALAKHAGSELWILSGKTSAVLVHESSASQTWGRQIVFAGTRGGDGRDRYLLTEYESQRGARCGGAVHLVMLRSLSK
jgi:hypothetical protein